MSSIRIIRYSILRQEKVCRLHNIRLEDSRKPPLSLRLLHSKNARSSSRTIKIIYIHSRRLIPLARLGQNHNAALRCPPSTLSCQERRNFSPGHTKKSAVQDPSADFRLCLWSLRRKSSAGFPQHAFWSPESASKKAYGKQPAFWWPESASKKFSEGSIRFGGQILTWFLVARVCFKNVYGRHAKIPVKFRQGQYSPAHIVAGRKFVVFST